MSGRIRTRPKLSAFLLKTRETFQQRYKETDLPSTLVAQTMLEAYVEQGVMDEKEALKLLGDGGALADFLLKAEHLYQQREDQKIHDRMSGLERNTDWKLAGLVSLGTGAITGLAFAFAGPFVGAWLQPMADQIFKRQAASPPQLIQNNYYISATQQIVPEKNGKISGVNKTTAQYKSSLTEILQRGDNVTVTVNGKKLSMCYRPGANRAAPKQAFAYN